MTASSGSIPFSATGQFPKLFTDYIDDKPQLRPFYTYRPSIDAFADAIRDKNKENIDRELLVKRLTQQYEAAGIKTSNHLPLADENTFTVCTGHQLVLFTGPLYFIFKIISTIKLAKQLSEKYPQQKFIPVYWMASEDHDFEEIRSVHLFNKKLSWEHDSNGQAVGRLSTESLDTVITELNALLGESPAAAELSSLFSEAYLKHNDLRTATRYLVHSLFSDQGLVILDGDDAELKKKFMAVMQDDLRNSTNYRLVSDTAAKLEALGYPVQVTPREINLFSLANNQRIRIEKADDAALALPAGMLSPNVVLRPLYQQMLLPNLAYVGGPGEIVYWLEYKAMFDHHKVAFPVLMPRNFALLTDPRSSSTLEKLGLSIQDLFRDTDQLIREYVTRSSQGDLSLAVQEDEIKNIFSVISTKVVQLDASLKASVEAEQQKALNSLKNIESKMIRAAKQKEEGSISQIRKLRAKFLPEDALQERYDNFIPYYLREGKGLFTILMDSFDPFSFNLQVINLS